MLGMVTPGGFLPIGHHIVSLIISYFTFRLRPQKSNSSSVVGIRLDYSCSIWPSGKNMQDAYRCVSRLYLHNPQRYWMNCSLVLNEWLICTEWLAHLYWMSDSFVQNEQPMLYIGGNHSWHNRRWSSRPNYTLRWERLLRYREWSPVN